MKIILAAFTFALLVSLLACSPPANSRTYPVLTRSVRPMFFPSSGPAPLFVNGDLGIQSDASDLGHDPFYSKIEVDFGDGTGWVDVTAQLEEYWDNGLRPQDLIVHVYSAPGIYTVRGRVTYWEGAVVYSESPYERTITVLPPEDAGS